MSTSTDETILNPSEKNGNVQNHEKFSNSNSKENEGNVADQEIQEVESEEDKNWRKVRKANEEARKRAVEAEQEKAKALEQVRLLQEAVKTLVDKEVPRDRYEEQDFEEDDVSARVRKELEKYRQEEEARRAEQEKASLPQVLRQRIPDFDEVCTAENLDYLEFKFPEIAIPYKYMPDSFEKWECVRNAIKKHMPNALGAADKRKIEENVAKPQSSSVIGMSQSAESGISPILSESRKIENWKNMQRRIKGY